MTMIVLVGRWKKGKLFLKPIMNVRYVNSLSPVGSIYFVIWPCIRTSINVKWVFFFQIVCCFLLSPCNCEIDVLCSWCSEDIETQHCLRLGEGYGSFFFLLFSGATKQKRMCREEKVHIWKVCEISSCYLNAVKLL